LGLIESMQLMRATVRVQEKPRARRVAHAYDRSQPVRNKLASTAEPPRASRC